MTRPLPVLVHAAGRDGELTARVLKDAGFDAVQCADGELVTQLSSHVGALVIAEEALAGEVPARIERFVDAQPAWSDLSILVVAQPKPEGPKLAHFSRLGNVSLLTRPMAMDTLVSWVRSALRARRRQFQVRELLEQQVEQGRRKDQFLAMLAHELRNPLAPVRYAAQALHMVGAEKVPDIARLLDRQVGHMGQIIDQLLDVTRVSRGVVRLERRTLDVGLLAAQSVEMHQTVAIEKNVRLAVQVDEALWVDADETRMKQVLDNLIDNALKFTGPGGEVRVSGSVEAGSVVLRVSDTGDGIDPKMLSFLFEPFMQADRSLDRTRGGLGLGLALVKGLVELHHGQVRVESEGPGRGSTFTLRLPLAQPGVQQAPAQPDEARAEAARLRVLVAEDNTDSAETLRLILQAYGHEVTVVHSGPAAVEEARRLKPDAILCDIGLPGMSGYEVAKRIRSEPAARDVLMIAVTGYGSDEDRSIALAAGFDAHFSKPVSPDVLVTQLRKLR